MAGRPPPLAGFGQGPYQGAAAGAGENNSNEDVWEVNLNLFEKPRPGNRKQLGNNRRAMALFEKPETPRAQIRVAANWKAPSAAGKPLLVRPNVYKTPNRRIQAKAPAAPKKNNGSRRRNRKSRRNTRRLRKETHP